MASSNASEIPCPDPSAHTHPKGQNLSEAASTAALYVTNPDRHTAERQVARENPLGDDGKLSSKSAAASLKYAKATELPSFPSAGLSANSAGKAAMLAKDYKMKDLWQPEVSEAGSRAALLAHRDGGKLDLWQHTPSAAGNSAATMAMKNKGLSPQLDYGYTADGKSRALLAATLSVSEGRRRAGSTPTPAPPAYPDSKNSAANALSAATASHRASSKTTTDGWNSEANQAARVQNLKAGKEWFGERPPVDIDPEDTKHQAALHASAKSMAKQMYDYQNQKAATQDLTGGTAGAQAAHANQTPQEQKDMKQEALKYIHLQDAAHKLAQERLAKVDKTMEAARYREYYGYGGEQQQTSPRKQANRLSMRSRPRNRAMSEGESALEDSDDEAQAHRIRTQMSQLNSGVNTVDEKKRSEDRAKLMAAAEKRVHDRMHDMDEKVFQDTGKVPPAMMEEWENKARKRAQEEREQQAQHPGQTHIGGGKFMNTSEIEAIAAARLKPTLDQITDTADKKRARDEEIRAEKEQQELTKRQEKAEKKQEKDEQKRTRDEEKAVVKQQKEEAKARKDEEKRAAQDNKRKSHDVKRDDVAAVGVATSAGNTVENDAEPTSKADKRSSTLGRIASRLRRKNKSEDDKVVEQKSISSRPATAIRSPVAESSEPVETANAETTSVVAADAAGTATEIVGSSSTQEHDATVAAPPPAIIAPDVDEDDELYDTHREMHPATQITTGRSGDHTGAVPVSGLSAGRPDLERHISTIETSDEDDDDVEDWDEDDDLDDDLVPSRSNATAGVFSQNELSPDQAQMAYSQLATDDEHHQHEAAKSAQVPVVTTTAAEETMGASKSAQVEPVSPSDLAESSTGPAPHTIGPHTTDIANILDPNVKPNPELQKVAIRENNAANDKKVNESSDGGPAPHTIGPHESDLANIVDPRVKPEPELMKEHTTTGPHKSDTLNKLDPNVASEPAAKDVQPASTPVQTSTTPVTSSKITKPETDEQPEKKGGLRGLLGKLRNKSSRSDNKLSKTPADDKTASSSAARTNTVTTTSSESTGAPRLSALDGTTSASFSDAVSSSLDEDELTRGRTGRATAPLTTTGHATDGEHPLSAVSTSNDEDTFEEARDHFDESLAPPATFAGQSKDLRESGSPVRGTKFVEEL